MDVPSLCIPRVFANVTRERVEAVFHELGIGHITRVDMVVRTGEKGEPLKRVFVHLQWNNSENARRARERLLGGNDIKIIYDEPWFWKVSANRSAPKLIQEVRPKKVSIQFSDDRELPQQRPYSQPQGHDNSSYRRANSGSYKRADNASYRRGNVSYRRNEDTGSQFEERKNLAPLGENVVFAPSTPDNSPPASPSPALPSRPDSPPTSPPHYTTTTTYEDVDDVSNGEPAGLTINYGDVSLLPAPRKRKLVIKSTEVTTASEV